MDERKNKILSGFRLCILLFIAVILAGSSFYYFYWLKTPQYTVGLIADAIKKHDIETFDKYVDTDSILNKAYDDYFYVYFSEDPFMQKNPVRNLAEGLIKLAKPMAVNEMKAEVDSYIKSGEWKSSSNEESSGEYSVSKNNSDITEKLSVGNIKFKRIKYTKVDGNKAVVGIETDKDEKTENTVIEISMEKQDDDTWRVVSIYNMKEYAEKIIRQKSE
ncbi:hypothetical protein [Pectinatus haikarae]|uniref:DUF2939 domain-containing protein n=1 Tax=Pectinatus haikarae TaxID=349096 RepID=A0ABT9Y644_9FIRM|nr:hypothetical protein [Pectinatus haikarae]MDQ0203303.1 hypothetical protein [Pectinatus haikarae]